MGLDQLILQMMIYITAVSGSFSGELKYDSQLNDVSKYGTPIVEFTTREKLFLIKDNRLPMKEEVIEILGLQLGSKIWLKNGWDINDPADQSILLHELVHYMQDANGMFYDCMGDKERLAYYIQEKWLEEKHGISIYDAIGLSPLSMVAAMYCPLPDSYAKPGEGGP